MQVFANTMPGDRIQMYYVGLDIHKLTVTYHVLAADGRDMGSGTVSTRHSTLKAMALQLPRPWTGVMEATLFTQHIYQTLVPYAHDLQVGDSNKMRSMNPDKHKSDPRDAHFFSQLVRCGIVPRVHVLTPQMYELRQALRYRFLLLQQAVRMRNKTAGLLMEAGIEYDKRRLQGRSYFADLIKSLDNVPEIVVNLLKHARGMADVFYAGQKKLLSALNTHPALRDRVARLKGPRAVGDVTALTWALEIGDPNRFRSIADAVSYCGLCAAEEESAGKRCRRGRLSPRCNMHLRTVLIETAKLAPRHNPQLAEIYNKALERTRNENLATIAVARKLVAWLLAIDKHKEEFTAQPL